MSKRLMGVIAAAGLLVSGAVRAAYPDHTIRMIVPYPPGGGADVVGRITAEKLTNMLGQSVIVDNRPGAASMIGSDMAAKSPADGYTILMGSVANTSIPAVYTHVTYDLDKDLTPVCRLITIPNVLVVGDNSPYHSVQDIIAAAKAAPGKLTFASSGTGATPHLSSELFMIMAGLKMVHIPYKGSGPAQLDLMANRISMMFDNASLPLIKGGKLRALAVSTPERSPVLPDVPTVAEAGVPGFAVRSWYGAWVPKGTPEPIVKQLEEDMTKIYADPDVKKKILDFGGTPDVLCGAQYAAFIDSELDKWSKLVRQVGIKINN